MHRIISLQKKVGKISLQEREMEKLKSHYELVEDWMDLLLTSIVDYMEE